MISQLCLVTEPTWSSTSLIFLARFYGFCGFSDTTVKLKRQILLAAQPLIACLDMAVVVLVKLMWLAKHVFVISRPPCYEKPQFLWAVYSVFVMPYLVVMKVLFLPRIVHE